MFGVKILHFSSLMDRFCAVFGQNQVFYGELSETGSHPETAGLADLGKMHTNFAVLVKPKMPLGKTPTNPPILPEIRNMAILFYRFKPPYSHSHLRHQAKPLLDSSHLRH